MEALLARGFMRALRTAATTTPGPGPAAEDDAHSSARKGIQTPKPLAHNRVGVASREKRRYRLDE